MKTALITGASSGIGRELAKQFAADGINVVLVARRRERLEALAGELERAYNIRTLIICKDLSVSASAQEIYDELKSQNISVEYLVNNAGYIVYGPFAQNGLEEELDMLQVNIMSLTRLTKLFVRDMLERGSGRILNIGSTGSFAPGPMDALYCASKAYVLSFSEALCEELKNTGITVTALCPGGTKTEFADKGCKDTFIHRHFVMSAEEVAVQGYKAFMKAKMTFIPGWFNKLLIFSIRFSPRKTVALLSRLMMS